MQYSVYLVLIASALTLPWWVTVPLMVFALSFTYGAPVVVGVAILMDSLYGTNINALYDISFLYTLVFTCAAGMSIILRARMLE
jgi:hypothetical protein